MLSSDQAGAIPKVINASSNRRAYRQFIDRHASRWTNVVQPWLDVASRREELPTNKFQTDPAKQEAVFTSARKLLYVPEPSMLAVLHEHFPHVRIGHQNTLLSYLMQPGKSLYGAIEFDNLRLNGLLPFGVFLTVRNTTLILAKIRSTVDLVPVGSGVLLYCVEGIKPLGERTSLDDVSADISHLGRAFGLHAQRHEPRFYVVDCEGQDAIIAHELEHCLSIALGSPFRNDEYIAALAEFAYGSRNVADDVAIMLHATCTDVNLSNAFRRIRTNLLGFFGMRDGDELQKITKEELRAAARIMIDRAYGGAIGISYSHLVEPFVRLREMKQ